MHGVKHFCATRGDTDAQLICTRSPMLIVATISQDGRDGIDEIRFARQETIMHAAKEYIDVNPDATREDALQAADAVGPALEEFRTTTDQEWEDAARCFMNPLPSKC